MNKIVILDAKTLGKAPNIGQIADFGKLIQFETTSDEETIEHIGDANIVITNKVVIDRHVLEQCPSIQLICISATGTNNVDLESANKLGIPVKNAAGYSSFSVAQQTFAYIFHIFNSLTYYDRYVKDGSYSSSDIFTHYGPILSELQNKTFGIIGLGNIGKTVANIAESFGAKVIFYSTSGKNKDSKYPSVSLDELLTKSDIVSIHAPLNSHTQGLIGASEFRKMKSSAVLINVGRGGIVNEIDLAEALDHDQIHTACLDVFEQEPIQPSNPLLNIKNPEKLVLTPHNAWSSVESRTKLVEIVYNNIKEFLGSKH